MLTIVVSVEDDVSTLGAVDAPIVSGLTIVLVSSPCSSLAAAVDLFPISVSIESSAPSSLFVLTPTYIQHQHTHT